MTQFSTEFKKKRSEEGKAKYLVLFPDSLLFFSLLLFLLLLLLLPPVFLCLFLSSGITLSRLVIAIKKSKIHWTLHIDTSLERAQSLTGSVQILLNFKRTQPFAGSSHCYCCSHFSTNQIPSCTHTRWR